VNGDGLADILVRRRSPVGEREVGGPVYVVFGSRRTTDVDVRSLGSRGFRIDTPPVAFEGGSIGTTGGRDVNGDGRADLAIVANGTVYVVFGRSETTPVRLDALGAAGYRAAGRDGGISGPVALLPDIDGDRRAEIAFAAGVPSVRVVYGRAAAGAARGFGVFLPPDRLLVALADAADTDGDGRGDLALAASTTEGDLQDLGDVTVVLADDRDVRVGAAGFRGYSVATGYVTALAGAGDVDADGHPDLLVGDSVADAGKNLARGGASVVFGRDSPAPRAGGAPPLLRIDSHAAHCTCAEREGDVGYAVAGAGDLNGDGRADLLVSGTLGYTGPGVAFVVFTPRIIYGTNGPDVLRGGRGNELFLGLGGDDVAFGGGGNDTLVGGDGDDRLDGGAGLDRVEGGAGADRLAGGEGDDDILGGSGPRDAYGGDAPSPGDGADLLRGGAGRDLLGGGPGDDLLDGRTGADRLYGEEGDDRLLGGSGKDVLIGDGVADWSVRRFWADGRGRDTILGGPGRDELWGGGGADVLAGGPGRDRILPGPGRDRVDGRLEPVRSRRRP
jgi:Ca2+-binding RTX toxin-like protein